MVTVLPFSAVPEIAGLVLLVDADTVAITGATGATVSTVKVIAVDAGEIFPAASVALAVMVWTASFKAVAGVNVQAPVVWLAITVPIDTPPS